MKYTKLLLSTFSIIILILMFSCDKSTTGPIGGGSIIGEWKESSAVVNLSLTTNSDQQATNILNSSGEIAITGDYNAKLKLMFYFEGDEDDDAELGIMNSFLGLGADTSYGMILDPTGVDKNGELEVTANDDSDFEDYLDNIIDYTFDETTLNITNTTVNSATTGKSTTLNGSISLNKINIPANQATMLSINSEHFYDFGNTTTTFFDDSTFISSEFAEDGNDEGTWSIIGDTLKITVAVEVEDPDTEEITYVDTTISFIYINYGNTFNISQSMDICEGIPAEGTDDEIGCDDILGLFEAFLDIDEGSLEKAEVIFQLFFELIPVTKTAKISNNSKSSWTNSLPQEFLQYLIENKRLFHK